MQIHSSHRNRERSRRQRFSSAIAASVEPIEARIFLAANPIVLENQLPGTPQSEWDVAGAGDISLQGFATDISLNRGTTVSFKIDDASLAQYHIDIYRMGYYGGMGARHVATIPSSQTFRQVQQAPAPDPITGLVDCGNWNVSATWNVPSTATSGIYFAKLVREDNGGASHIMFIVRDDSSHSDVLFQTSDSTWEAYNNYGGSSLYEADDAVPGSEEAATGRAVKVSYNRPLTVRGTSGGLGDYNSPFHAEYPMVRWLEANGYDVSYFTDVDSARLGSEIRNHAVFASVGHDEYWSGEQRANVEAARDAGVNLAFFSGNEIFWKTRWENDVHGDPYRTLVTYKESKANAVIDPADPPTWTGTWRDMRFSPPADGGRPENALSGTAYMNDRTNVDIGIGMQVPAADGKLRFWRNTAVSSQSTGQVATIGDRVVGYETDEDLDNGFRPAGLMDMSSTTFTTNSHVVVPWGSEVAPGTSTHKITLYRAPSGALVFGAGTVQWSWGLDGQHDDGVGTADSNIQQATVNLLADMSVQPTTPQAGLVPAVASTDVTGPVTTITSPANNANLQASSSVTISGTAADTGGGIVAGVEVSVDGGKTWHPATGREAWSYSWIPVVGGPIKVLARASDDSGNLGASASTNVIIAFPATSSSNLVASYNFNAGAGTTLSDVSGHGNNGTIANATWTSLGRYGNALSFNGVDSMVTVADSNTLDLTTGMTLEAWVKPTSFNGWENVLLKERTGGLVYSLYASDDINSAPTTDIRTASGDYITQRSQSVQLNQWTHLASTFDGTTLRLYVNGNLASSADVNGSMAASTGALRIGADSVFGGENFQGFIDDIRIYNRALSATELSADLSTSIGGTIDATAPTGAMATPINGSTVAGNVTLTANASDNAAVAGVTFLLNGNPISNELSADPGLPYTFQWNSTTVANGSYTMAARVRDVAGNVTTTSGVAVTVSNPADTVLPTITLTSPTGGAATGTPVLNAVASDNIRLAGVQFKVNGANLGSEITSGPFRQPWNTASLTTGTYTLTAVARDAAGNLTTSNAVQVTVDNSPPQVTGQLPTSSATNVATSAVESATFSKPVQPGTISIVVKDSTNHVISGAVSYFNPTNTVFFTPDLTLSPSAVYTVTVSGAKDNAGVLMSAPVTWSFTTRAQVTDATIFRNQVPSNTSANDSNAIEVGVKFRVDMPGTITGIRFYRGINNTGQHIGHLWKSDGTLLGTVTFTGESGTGWQLANFSTPIAVTPGVTYVASYYAPDGRYSADNGTFATSGIDNAPLHALANGDNGAQGVYLYASGGGFPTSPGLGSNYWVDVLFTSAIDTTPPTVSSSDPTTSATGVSTASSIQATFSEQVQSSTISFILKDNQGNTVPADVSYSAASQTATLTPTGSLSTSTAYTATISGVKDLSGNSMSAPFSWSFTTAATSTFTLWSKTSAPVVASANDAASIEVGLKFRASVDGTISGIRFYKGAGNTGTHVGHLWSSAGQLLASMTFTNESSTGWQVATLSSAISILANTTYVVSYTAPNGHYAADGGTFASSGVDSGPLHAPASPTVAGNGVYLYGVGFPTNSFNATNYWVDVLFQQSIADTTPPSIATRTPAAGAVEVSRTTAVSATFSEAIQPAGVVFTLTDGNGASVSGTTSYDSNTQTITFVPSVTLDVAGQYTASISGVKDLSENAMATATWSFTTSSAASQTPAGITVWPNTTTPTVASANDSSSLELGMKFRTDLNGTVTGIRFYKGTGNTGTHVGHLWDANGNLLASVTFTNETATGWQTAAFSTPVTIAANSVYVISYYAPAGHYAVNSGYFTTTGVNNGALHALANGVSGPNGVFIATAGGAFPTNSFGAANYWVDLYFLASTDQTPPVISNVSASTAPTSAVVTWSTDEPADSQVQYGTTASYGSTTTLDSTLVTSHSVPLSGLTGSTLYHYRIVTRDAAGNQAVSGDFTFITGGVSYSVWDNSATPAVASVNDPNAVEVGTKIRVDVNGVITGIRFYKGAGNTGTHVGHLWDANGNLLASVTFSNETASGWQTATFSTPVAVTSGVTYVISYYAPNGGYAATSAYFASSGAGSGPVHALASGVDGADGLYRYGSGGGFPTSSYNSSNYWVDVVFQPTP